MKAMRTKVGGVELLIEVVENAQEEVEILSSTTATPPTFSERETVPTGIQDEIRDAYMAAKALIREVAVDFSDNLAQVTGKNTPTRVALEFGLSFSAKASAWVLTGEGGGSLKITMEWNQSEPLN